MQNAERFAIAAVISGLRKSGAIDDAALGIIADELAQAVEDANQYDSSSANTIERLAADVRKMQAR
ncbi:hypothetical protein [Sphingomonas sp. CV7422]|uniref:hypothetical protein n=1 Tax=Sphingomonas sp. CV7422 TaxID=3018036 RepID=UPI0022FF0150|nr:hypothetical protein [Sphingomonas sp. CV7422]